ncbi:hypothetical protein GGTG_11775 [Gaeumannomyces tritici R3-111a-1]|uniref:Uncharacterized protein n=1 Tax=Gaeumannomyces tritici (strain R3-111a-1) TaxID=644352 RepID=J3PE52_GAET3|nr:hypothetical protein GGTG_11775 [Gaeumannomyces tritici R3-111a-1]EJT70752.1 hypothetical protein GGTG_11775 [Gaeumannomyces tritici R3-111a-1]
MAGRAATLSSGDTGFVVELVSEWCVAMNLLGGQRGRFGSRSTEGDRSMGNGELAGAKREGCQETVL